jgi:hypothetical protein
MFHVKHASNRKNQKKKPEQFKKRKKAMSAYTQVTRRAENNFVLETVNVAPILPASAVLFSENANCTLRIGMALHTLAVGKVFRAGKAFYVPTGAIMGAIDKVNA